MNMIIKSSLPFYELKKMIQINFRNLKSTKKTEKPLVERKNTIEPFPINSKQIVILVNENYGSHLDNMKLIFQIPSTMDIYQFNPL